MTNTQRSYAIESDAPRLNRALNESLDNVRTLRAINAELVAALRECITDPGATCHRNAKYQRMRTEYINQIARAAISRATGAA